MTIQVEIPESLAAKVSAAAKFQGTSPEAVVLDAVVRTLDPLAELDSALAPVRQAFLESGVSEDEAVEEFEREKHALRRERNRTEST